MTKKTTSLAFDADREALDDLAQTLAELASDPSDGTAGEETAEIELRLADLMSDLNDEIVFFNDSGARTIGLTASAPVVADGWAADHVTAEGVDVSGYRFVSFENGPTLYFEAGLDMVVRPADGGGP